MIEKIKNTLKKRWGGNCGYAEVLRVGLPLVVSMASVTVILFTDRLFLSHYSLDAIAAALPAGLVHLTIMLTLTGLCAYSSVFIAQYTGAGQKEKVGLALWQGIWIGLICSTLFTLCYFIADIIFSFGDHSQNIKMLEIAYFRILCLGATPFLLNAVLGGFYAGRGITKPVLWANLLAAFINIPLDYILIFGKFGFPELGVEGAALASVAGALAGTIFFIFLIFTKENEELFKVLSNYKFNAELIKKILRYGTPSGINLFLELFSVTWFVFIVGQLGKLELAATNIAFSINSLVFVPMLGLNMAAATLVGQSMGRNKPDEAERATENTLHLAFAYMLPVAMFMLLAPEFLLGLFKPKDMDMVLFNNLLATGKILLAFIAVYSLVDACNLVYFGALKGAGDTMFFMILMSCSATLLIIGLELAKRFGFAELNVYWSIFTVYVFLLAFLSRKRFLSKKWQNIRLITSEKK
ncbi:MATE family efflux transporter [Desulfovibrio litoralis]|uniref:Multidrug-efflux transporter n=1 Tax=Desulfovibrio litoralis DSM 11393 TaxID=1121455 RepID=A0A1M7S8W9_9BACT|nr:MATE family efflux transporter [Desulfovibrio litoralis]SHN54926.1 multidrug resistance protein, MATE family [Desulfovibrio litoralis DSM 11393]